MELRFTKMHGLGNDFIVIDDRAEDLVLSPEAVEWFCDRNFGIGADGLILVRNPTLPDADLAWWFRNADGSIAEMCGNGIRCFAKYAADRGLIAEDTKTVRVETALGVYSVDVVRDEDGAVALATVDMGEPILDPREIPTTLGCETPENPVLQCSLETELGTYALNCVSMGNPHAVIFVDDVESAPVLTLGPLIENHPVFPNKTNVEFAQVIDDDVIRLRVWERGVGETLACGTGACATAVAAALNCLIGRDSTIELPGGDLGIRWAENGRVYMTGPAAFVFDGFLPVREEEDGDAPE